MLSKDYSKPLPLRALTPAFKGVGQSYIQFAINEPKLFQLLFMRKTSGKVVKGLAKTDK